MDLVDDITPGSLGRAFDSYTQMKITMGWQNARPNNPNNFSDLPDPLRTQLNFYFDNNLDYELFFQVKVSNNGRTPVPDILFVPRNSEGILDFDAVEMLDAKYLWDVDFSSAQRQGMTTAMEGGQSVQVTNENLARAVTKNNGMPAEIPKGQVMTLVSYGKLTSDNSLSLTTIIL